MLDLQRFLLKRSYRKERKKILDLFEQLKKDQYLSAEHIKRKQLAGLNTLLQHACSNIAYYKNLFEQVKLAHKGQITLASYVDFQKIPFLTKDIIQKEKESIYVPDHTSRGSYCNTSGGSTGEPVRLLQDYDYSVHDAANFLLVKSWRGADPFDSEIILWGAEKDIFKGKKSLGSHIRDFVSNRIILNTFSMTPEEMPPYIKKINRHKPKLIRAYVSSLYELARFAKENNIRVEQQHAVHAAAGTVYPFMRDLIEEVFQCRLFNHYGSREVGAVASECSAHDGMHIMMEHCFLEVVDHNGCPCRPGDEGDIVITTLSNYSMPLIRYKIGDRGILQPFGQCACGCNYPKLQHVTGRSTDVFKTKYGGTVDGEYFTHLFYFIDGIRQFQVIQKATDHLLVRIVKQGDIADTALAEITGKIHLVMGKQCRVEFTYVKEIEKTKTGKVIYTLSEV